VNWTATQHQSVLQHAALLQAIGDALLHDVWPEKARCCSAGCACGVQEVCAVSRRASAAGPALLVHFNPYTRTSLSGMVPLAAAPPAADGAAADDGHASAGAWGGVADTADDGAACSREAGAVASEASALQSDSAADESGTLAVERAGDTGGDWSVMESDDLRIAAAE
jgi:hypothetical protein